MWTSFFQFSEETSSMSLPLVFTILALFLFLFLLKKWSLLFNNRSAPPSPRKLPIIGNLHQLGTYPHRSLRALAQTHGPIMFIHLGSVPVLVISSATLAREIMKTHDLVFADRPGTKMGKMLLYDNKDVAAAPYGEYWRQTKSICVLHLLSNRRVQSYAPVREEETALMIETITNSCSDSAVNLSEAIVGVTNHVVSRVALGRKYSPVEAGRNFKELLGEFLSLLGGFDVGDFVPWLGWVNHVTGLYTKVERVAKEVDDFLEKVVEEHIASGGVREDNSKDFVDVLLWIQKENMAGFPIDRTCIKAIILDVFAAGTETTYTVVEWAMTELLKHPDIMTKVQTELRQNATNKSFITEKDSSEMKYLKAVIKETLRLHPPIPLLVPRISMKAVQLQGFEISARTQVIINAFAIGRDPEVWDRAEEFWPDRFLNSSIDFKGQDFELIPFGSGRRICPGVEFAMKTDELVLANLLYKFDWTLSKEEDSEVVECTGLTIHRKFPLFAFATPYNS
ncbi:cytochrome P450 736A117-like [Mercurialis annua]|uniref:cytochrome P450 736A117-like n=1 Tax=Mercurialis annua TaxID=3986 RepID=UPI00216006E9|nr:cytochrome P450 736A117-like [Mercurialis annua]